MEYKVGSYLLFFAPAFFAYLGAQRLVVVLSFVGHAQKVRSTAFVCVVEGEGMEKKYSEGLKRDVFCNARRGILNKPPRSIFPNISGLTRTYLARLCSGWVSVSMGSFYCLVLL